jgi:hypothetical protein
MFFEPVLCCWSSLSSSIRAYVMTGSGTLVDPVFTFFAEFGFSFSSILR